MSETPITLAGSRLTARPTGALWWPEAALLCVSDLHLGKSERLARRGGALLPPYETLETIARLEAEVAALEPRTVICLGDSFDDSDAMRALDESSRARLGAMMSGRRWIWVAGNHDPAGPGIGGSHMEEVARGALTFRHIARPRGAEDGEVSGHYHPKARVTTRAGRVSRPCFVHDGRRLILPAFGAYTGGLDCGAHPVQSLFGDDAVCILTGRQTAVIPLRPRESA